jgi:hypothetical protein
MTAFNAATWLGLRTVRPSDDALAQIDRYDTGLHRVALGTIIAGLGYFTLPLTCAATVNNATVEGLAQQAKIPFKVVGADVGVESAAGSACTANVMKAPAATPTVYATMLTAAVDVKTNAGIMQAAAILDGSEDVEVGDRLRLEVIGTGAGAVVGSSGLLHCFRL